MKGEKEQEKELTKLEFLQLPIELQKQLDPDVLPISKLAMSAAHLWILFLVETLWACRGASCTCISTCSVFGEF